MALKFCSAFSIDFGFFEWFFSEQLTLDIGKPLETMFHLCLKYLVVIVLASTLSSLTVVEPENNQKFSD